EMHAHVSFLTRIKPCPSYPRRRRTAIDEKPVRHCARHEGKEVQPDARPQDWNNPSNIRSNTLGIFSSRERCRWLRLVRRRRTINVGQVSRTHIDSPPTLCYPHSLANRLGTS